MPEIVVRLHAAARHDGIGDADGRGAQKRLPNVSFIVVPQMAPVNDTENLVPILVPKLRGKLRRRLLQLLVKTVCRGNAVAAFQRIHHRLPVILPVLPEIRPFGVFTAARVGYVKHIAEGGSVAAVVDQRDACAAATDIAAHPAIPHIVVRAGRRLRALGIDHHLFQKRVLVKPRRRGEKGRPFLMTAGELFGGVRSELGYGFVLFIRHRQCPPCQSPASGQAR